jgi:hypothetical protein
MEMFVLKKLKEVRGKEQYCVELSNRFSAFENLGVQMDIIRASETVIQNIKISAKKSLDYELK